MELELEFVTQTQDLLAGDLLVSSGMGQIYPKNYPVAEIISVYVDPGQEFATVRARPLAQINSTRHVMLVFNQDDAVDPVTDDIESDKTLLPAGRDSQGAQNETESAGQQE
jgi:rod shape-determining protein MreC